MKPALALLLLTTLAITVGCSSETGSPTPVGTQPSSTAPHATVVSGGGTSTVVEPPVTFAGTDASAAEVFAGLEVQLPMSSDGERACAAEALSRDAELLARVRSGVAPNSEDLRALNDIVARCRISVTAAQQFAKDFADTHPSATAEQLTCLRRAFGALDPADVDALLTAALTPPGSEPSAGIAILEKLLSDCGVTA